MLSRASSRRPFSAAVPHFPANFHILKNTRWFSPAVLYRKSWANDEISMNSTCRLISGENDVSTFYSIQHQDRSFVRDEKKLFNVSFGFLCRLICF